MVMAVLLRRCGRLGGGCFGMMGRILLATIIMTIFLVVLTNFGSGFKAFYAGSVLASWSDSSWWRCLSCCGFLF